MTDIPDWADEMAMGWKDGEFARAELAADFRKAKAAGLREAVEIVNNIPVTVSLYRVSEAIRAAADKLEESGN